MEQQVGSRRESPFEWGFPHFLMLVSSRINEEIPLVRTTNGARVGKVSLPILFFHGVTAPADPEK